MTCSKCQTTRGIFITFDSDGGQVHQCLPCWNAEGQQIHVVPEGTVLVELTPEQISLLKRLVHDQQQRLGRLMRAEQAALLVRTLELLDAAQPEPEPEDVPQVSL